MEYKCSKCNRELKKGVVYKDFLNNISVKFNPQLKNMPNVVYPYVCLNCGKVEWYIDLSNLKE